MESALPISPPVRALMRSVYINAMNRQLLKPL
jgi:hypothetical protein